MARDTVVETSGYTWKLRNDRTLMQSSIYIVGETVSCVVAIDAAGVRLPYDVCQDKKQLLGSPFSFSSVPEPVSSVSCESGSCLWPGALLPTRLFMFHGGL